MITATSIDNGCTNGLSKDRIVFDENNDYYMENVLTYHSKMFILLKNELKFLSIGLRYLSWIVTSNFWLMITKEMFDSWKQNLCQILISWFCCRGLSWYNITSPRRIRNAYKMQLVCSMSSKFFYLKDTLVLYYVENECLYFSPSNSHFNFRCMEEITCKA